MRSAAIGSNRLWISAGALAIGACAFGAPASPALAATSVAGATRGAAPGLPPDNWTVTAPPHTKTLLVGRVEYDPGTCTAISQGSWTVTTPPKYGNTSFAPVVAVLGNGDCPGILFTFAGIYYKWPGGDHAGKIDHLAATWSTSDLSFNDTFDVTLAVSTPVNFHQVGDGVAKPDGVLHFEYAWDSSSGDLADLSPCTMGEDVEYPGSSNPFVWPKPPYNGSTPNPTILWVPGANGAAQDNHSHTDFITPYQAKRFVAKQTYRYRCPTVGIVNFTGFDDIHITRNVSDSTGRGCFGYEITKSGASASVPRLPHVKAADCTAKPGRETAASDARLTASAADVGLALAAPPRAAGLGEPLYADISVSNLQARRIDVDLGLNRNANLVLTIRAPGGEVETRTLGDAGFGRSGRLSLAPHQSVRQRLLLNEWYDFSRVGTYRVTLALKPDGAPRGGRAAPSTDFAVEVGPRDAAALQRISQHLAEAAVSGATFETRMIAATSLGHINDPAAVASLKQVLDHGQMVESYAIAGLARIHTPDAVAALMAAAQHHPDKDVRSAARLALIGLDGSAPQAPQPRD